MKRIAIHSVPRSGSTWLGEIFNSHANVIYKYQPLFSYAFKGRLTATSSKAQIVDFFRDIADSDDDFINQTNARNEGKMPLFSKDTKKEAIVYKEVRYHHILHNLLVNDKDVKIIGLIRNPKATIHSWLNAPKEFRKDLFWDELEEWKWAKNKNLNKLEEYNGYEKWKEVAYLFHDLEQKFPLQFKLINYSDLVTNTTNIVIEIFEFCELSFNKNVKLFLENSSSNSNADAYSVFKRKTNDNSWKGKLNPIIVEEIDNDLMGTEFEKYLTE